MMTDEQLRAIAALCDAATPGSWKSGWSWQDAINGGKSAWSEGPVHVGDTLSQVAPQAIADAAFIAAARQDVPALLAEIDALRRQLAECQAQAEEAQRESYRRGADADRAVADARRERDAARAEAVELRRQLAETQAEIAAFVAMRAAANAAIAEAADLRRQLVKAEDAVTVLRIRLSLDKPLPPPTCGHRGMAGSVGCILPAGHAGEHEYRTFADDHPDDVALRRQLAECQATMAEWREIAIARGEALGYAEADADCTRG